MLHYLLKKLAQLAITMVGVAALIFFLLHVLPGDIVEVKFRSEGGQVSEAVLQQERARLGLDRPLPAQFLDWMGGLARLDLGKSMWTDRPVAEEISMRFSITLEVALLAMIIGTLIAIPMGVGAALA